MSLSAARRLRIETLEDRTVPSWGGTPPASVAVPSGFTSVSLNGTGDASGSAAITANEVDWYKVTVAAGSATLSATTPTSSLDTVLGVYTAGGSRVAYNDDISYPSNTDSRVTVTLSAGTYYVGVTNYAGTAGGAYTWAVDSATPPTVPPTVPPPPPPTAGGFAVTVRTTGLSLSQQAVFQQAAARWAQVITGDVPDATYNGVAVDDVLIDASGAAIDGAGGILGQAGPDRLRSGSLLPIHGVMQFDTADLAALEQSGQLLAVITHEMGHVLGIGTIWQQKGLLTGAGGTNPLFTGAQATAAYDQIFGTTGAVPVENSGGSGTRDAHWRETTFGRELMTGYLNSGTNPLSRVTVASLGDLGYTVNLAAADAYTPGAGLVAGGGGGGTTGGAGLVAADDFVEPGVVLDTVPVVEGPSVRPDWATPAEMRPDAVTLPAAPTVRRLNLSNDEARPTPRPTVAADWRAVRPAVAAADDFLLGVMVG